MNQALKDKWAQFRKSGGSIAAIESPDPAETIASLVEFEGEDKIAAFRWDISRGIESLTDLGAEALSRVIPKPPAGSQSAGASVKALTKQPADALGVAYRLADVLATRDEKGNVTSYTKSLFFMLNAHLYLGNEAATQGIWNLRDQFKEVGATCVLLGPAFKMPPHLINDVPIFNEPRPTPDDLRRIALGVLDARNDEQKRKKLPALAIPDTATIASVVGAMSGLAAYPAEQAAAMNILDMGGFNIGGVWEYKMAQIGQMPGVTVWSGNERFSGLKGQDNLQRFGLDMLEGGEPPTVICLFDEADKGFNGSPGDLSGVSQELFGYHLTKMNDLQIPGMILLGPGGSGKTAWAKALVNENKGGKVLLLIVNAAGMKSSLVGSSMINVINFYNMLEAISGGRVVFVFTCNAFNFTPEFLRRATFGKWFVDLPTAEEVAAIWPIYMRKYELPKQPIPECLGWTGAEVQACNMMSYKFGKPLVQTAKYIVPIAVAAADKIDLLRQEADGNLTSASKPGVYRYTDTLKSLRRGRLIDGSATQN